MAVDIFLPTFFQRAKPIFSFLLLIAPLRCENSSVVGVLHSQFFFKNIFFRRNEANSSAELVNSIGRFDSIVSIRADRRCRLCKRLESEALSFRYLFSPGGIPSPLKHFQLKEEEIEFREKKKKDGVAYC